MNFNSRYEFNPKKDFLGKGGFSKVYKANDTLLDRTVALKFFTATVAEKYKVLNEIKRVIKFEHPNLCKYYDVAVLDSKNVFGETELIEVGIMEYLDAGEFKTFIRANPQYIDKLLIDVLKGLSYLHRKGIVHRDLKPQNIIIKMEDDGPVAKITDFGISKLISADDNNSSALIGTIEYMAPEQFNPQKYGIGGKVTTNLDLWSFGLLVYEVLAHKPLFGSRKGGDSAAHVMRNILSDDYLAKSKLRPGKYQAIVDRCLVKEASKRAQSALELIPLFDTEPGGPENPGNNPATAVDTSDDLSELSDMPQSIPEPEEDDYVMQTLVVNQVDALSLKTDSGPIANNEGSDSFTHTRLLPQAGETEEDATQVFSPSTNKNIDVLSLNEETPDNTMYMPDGDAQSFSNDDETTVVQRPQNLPPKIASEKETQHVKPVSGTAVSDQNKRKKILLYAGIPIVLLLLFFIFRQAGHRPTTIIEPNRPTGPDSIHTIAPPSIKPDMVYVKGGDFIMGNGSADTTSAEVPEHQVSLADFSIGKYEVTIDQFRQFINETKFNTTAEKEGQSGIYVKGKWETGKGVNWRHDIDGTIADSSKKNVPVVHVSWFDATKYCEWLSEKTKKHFQLPTEAQWEYAARGGTRSNNLTYSGSDKLEEVAWASRNSGNQLHPVGTRKPNELGIYDMSGNVMEWCADWYDKNYYKISEANAPKGPADGADRVVRGGSWFMENKHWFYTFSRAGFKPNISGSQLGFRICEVNN